MHAQSLTRALVGAAALMALAGCGSSATTSLEQEPGELDYDVGVTRAAILHGVPAEGLEFDWWTNETVDRDNDDAAGEVTGDMVETGLEPLCNGLAGLAEGPMASWYADMVAQEAVRGAVLSSMSEEFREAYTLAIVTYADYGEASEEELQTYLDTMDRLKGELHDEWVELYELQETLEEQVYSVEGARTAQAAVAERCDMGPDDYEPAEDPAQPVNQRPIQPPAMAGEGSRN